MDSVDGPPLYVRVDGVCGISNVTHPGLPQKAPDTTPRGTHPSDLAVMLSKPAAEDGPRLKAPEEMQRRPSELAESTSDMLMKLMEARSSVQSEPLPDTKPPPRPASRLVLQPTTVPKAAPRPSDGPAQKLSEAEQFAEELNLQPLQPLTLATVEGNYVDIPSVASPAAAPKPLPAVPVIMPSRPMPQSALPASIMSAPPIKENPPQTEYGALPLSLPSDDEGLVTPPPNHRCVRFVSHIRWIVCLTRLFRSVLSLGRQTFLLALPRANSSCHYRVVPSSRRWTTCVSRHDPTAGCLSATTQLSAARPSCARQALCRSRQARGHSLPARTHCVRISFVECVLSCVSLALNDEEQTSLS